MSEEKKKVELKEEELGKVSVEQIMMVGTAILIPHVAAYILMEQTGLKRIGFKKA